MNTTPKDPHNGYAATIGFFDGVHLGHRFLLAHLKAIAAERGLRTMVVTFDPHPQQVLCPERKVQLLTTLDEKRRILETEMGIDRVLVLSFDRQLAAVTARDFICNMLPREGVKTLLMGYDNHIGHRQSGQTAEGFDQYAAYGRLAGIEVLPEVACEEGSVRYSSSLVRRLLAEGRVAEAARCLGRGYRLRGRVVHGRQVGRQLGFPTANIEPGNSAQIVPQFGVYCVKVWPELHGNSAQGVMNIGLHPTFGGDKPTLEVHLLDFQGDLYDREIEVEFVARLRPEKQFSSPLDLVAQLRADEAEARKILQNYG